MRLAVVGLLAACAREPVEAVYDDPSAWERDLRLAVAQEEGQVHWILPAQRELGLAEFGTPGRPLSRGDLPVDVDPAIASLLGRYPTIVGVPLALRGKTPDLQRWTQTLIDVPYGGPLAEVTGALRLQADDRVTVDPPTGHATPDEASGVAEFTDPLGHRYRVSLREVIVPPFPAWETAGGVLHASFVHGLSGPGSPLMPEAFAWLAVWGLGDVYVDGVLTDSRMLVAFETIEAVRDRSGRLVQTLELPLDEEDTIAGEPFHTHLFVFPIRFDARGPVYEPVDTRMSLPGGEVQGEVHVIYEGTRIVGGPAYERPPP